MRPRSAERLAIYVDINIISQCQTPRTLLLRPRSWFATPVSAFTCSEPQGRWHAASTTRSAHVNLTNGQFSLMMSLNRPEPPGMASVASLLAMDRTTLTAALKPLQRRGLVKITADPADGRARLMTLTPKGRRLLVQAVPIWQSTHLAVESLLRDRNPDRLRKNLRALS